MKYYRAQTFLLLISVWVLSSCGTTDTVVVVEQRPVTGPADQTETESEEPMRYTEISIGLTDPVTNMDPLFAESLSAKRVISLLFDGLVTLGRQGEPELNLASDIEISEDGRIYTITIDRENFYRSSSVFPTGIGRRIHAADVKYAFERAADNSVPPHAGKLLKGISGFENYFLEQRTLYDEDRRVLSEVHGIRVIDAETVIIELSEPDDEFLKKLGSPYLVIYPPEAVENNRNGLAENPVGTGDYHLSSMEEDLLVLVRRERDNRGLTDNLPAANRINLRYFENEMELIRNFMAGETDWIPDAGPLMQNQMLDSDGRLMAQYSGAYGVQRQNAERLTYVYLNEQTESGSDWLHSRLATIAEEDFQIQGDLRMFQENLGEIDNSDPDSAYYVTLTDDFYARTLFNQMHSEFFQPESSLVYFDIRIPIPFTSLYSGSTDSLHKRWLNGEQENVWLELESEIVSIYHLSMQNIEPSEVPWHLHLQELTVQEPN